MSFVYIFITSVLMTVLYECKSGTLTIKTLDTVDIISGQCKVGNVATIEGSHESTVITGVA